MTSRTAHLLFFLSFLNIPFIQSADRMVSAAKIAGFMTASTVAYGIVNDMCTAHICREYFTEGFHKEMADRFNPTLKSLALSETSAVVALTWGVLATWHVGLLAGALTGAAAQMPLPRATHTVAWHELKQPLKYVFGSIACAAVVAGTLSYFAGPDVIKGRWGDTPPEKRKAWVGCVGAHLAAYFVGTVGALGVIGWTLSQRFK